METNSDQRIQIKLIEYELDHVRVEFAVCQLIDKANFKVNNKTNVNHVNSAINHKNPNESKPVNQPKFREPQVHA